jgi:DNA mismatch repair ATPase MutS
MGSGNIKAYCYYKQQYPETVVFFRVGNNYEIYQEDAKRVGKIIGLDTEDFMQDQESSAKLKFPIDIAYEYAFALASHNIVIKMISQRNQDGEFDVPDIDELQMEKEIDC